ncbi:VOC family protein [Salinarimonas rosea]|uniref:VOC family protein n=1 Tax=Salinarimonas rosea TaxID=552063 RepID=UPI0004285CEE|nr:VOC family protein [Salinarimonas rosea]
MKLRYTILYVEDVPASLAFYERAFGLARGMLHPSNDYGELATGNTTLSFSSRRLIRALGKDPAAPDPARPSFEIAFETDDVEAAFARAVEAGATPKQAPRREEWGQTTSYVTDPDGYLVEICSAVPG